METTPTVGTLNEKIENILDNADGINRTSEGDAYDYFNKHEASKAIKQLILEEVGKAWIAGAIRECHLHLKLDVDEIPPTKEEYITSLTNRLNTL